MSRRDLLKRMGLGAAAWALAPDGLAKALAGAAASPAARPNIIVILADDVGYGDVGCYGATKVKTPHLDRLAAEGLRFTDAHASAATCTPTRYSLLTGEYAWRKPGTGILSGLAKLCIEPGRPTLPALLKKAGYATGCVGKWHLGLGTGNVDYNGQVQPGPLEIGFDSCFIIPATGDRVPCVYVEDRRVVGLDPKDPIQVSYGRKVGDEPTGRENPELLKMKFSHGHDCTIVNGISRIGYMAGGKAARWVDEDMGDTITAKAVAFIEKHKDRPFFLYFATHEIHVPRVPHARFKGTSQCGVRGDVVQEFDGSVGRVMAAVDRLGLAGNTLLIATSDNGPVLDDGYADGAVADLHAHAPAGPLRGGKYSSYEGGTRMPFLLRWPKRVKPGVSDALVCQIDLLASLAALVGQELPDDAGPDSFNVLPALLGESKQGRDHLVEQGRGLALRQGAWKFIPKAQPRGRKAAKGKKAAPPADAGAAPQGELYNLADDLGEMKDLAARHGDKVKEMADLLQAIRRKGRTRP
jgi:arylsulfatase A-like enzyme